MSLPSVETAYNDLQHAPARGAINVDVQVRIASLAAAVQVEAAQTTARASAEAASTVADASEALRASIDHFTEASNRGTDELAAWTRNTAKWTKWLVFATGALVLASVVQVLVMWLAKN